MKASQRAAGRHAVLPGARARRAGRYARAAECLRKANALTLELNRKRRDYSPGEHQEFVDMLLEDLARAFLNGWRRRVRVSPAGVRVRSAALGHDADRAGAGEPSVRSMAPVNYAWCGGRSRASEMVGLAGPPRDAPRPANAGCHRVTGCDPSGAAGQAGWRTGAAASWTRCPTTTCTWDCLPCCSRARRSCIAGATARHGGFVLDDRFSQHPLGQLARAYRQPVPAIPRD